MVTKPSDFVGASARQGNGDDPAQHHILYDKHIDQVALINDLYNGIDSTVQYLFKFPQEIEKTFQDRQSRATLRNFLKRAVQAFTGMIFRKPIEIYGYGKRTEKLFEKIDTKNNIQNFTKEVAKALTKDGITYILADAPRDGSGGKPYLMQLDRSQVINWRKDEFDNFTMVVIEEVLSEPYGQFGTKYIKQWRVYDEDANITLYRSNTDRGNADPKDKKFNSGYYVHEFIETGFTSIPIVEVLIDHTPILYDIAKLNVKHFNRLSHKDRYLTMAALPIPVIWGADVTDDGDAATAKPALVIGVDEAFLFSSKDEGDFQWRELSGNSIDQLEKDLDSIVEDITTGILRAAETANAVQKTATEVQLLQAEASNRVTEIANSVEIGMREAIEMLSDINNEAVPSDATFLINKDFNASLMGSEGGRIAMEAYLQGLLSMETFLQTLSDMELINIDSAKNELERIKSDNFTPAPRAPLPAGTDKRVIGATEAGTQTPTK